MSHDISEVHELRQQQRASAAQAAQLAEVVDGLADPIFRFGTQAQLEYANAAALIVLERNLPDLRALPLSHWLDAAPTLKAYGTNTHTAQSVETNIHAKNDDAIAVELHLTPLFDGKGNYDGLAAVAYDLRARNRHEEDLERLAQTDPLTGLLNRRGFEAAAVIEIARVRRYQNGLSIISVDLDHFKLVNDQFGHAGGDTAWSR